MTSPPYLSIFSDKKKFGDELLNSPENKKIVKEMILNHLREFATTNQLYHSSILVYTPEKQSERLMEIIEESLDTFEITLALDYTDHIRIEPPPFMLLGGALSKLIQNNTTPNYGINLIGNHYHSRSERGLFSSLQFDRKKLIEYLNQMTIWKEIETRQLQRLERLDQGQEVIIPHYYHATKLDSAASIIQSGIESVKANVRYGAYFSNFIEFKYGTIGIGISKKIERASRVSSAIVNEPYLYEIPPGSFWVATHEMIHFNPALKRLKQRFFHQIEVSLHQLLHSPGRNWTNFQRLTYLNLFLQRLKAEVILRPTRNEKQDLRWSLNYRPANEGGFRTLSPGKDLQPIKNQEDFITYLTRISQIVVDEIIAIVDDETKLELSTDELSRLATTIVRVLSMDETMSIEREISSEVKIPLIYVDNDPKAIRLPTCRRLNTAESILTIKQCLEENKIPEEAIEFIPYSHYLIESDLLERFDSNYPTHWKERLDSCMGWSQT